MNYSDGDLADWLNDVGEEDDQSDSVGDSSTSARRVESPDAPDLADPDALADGLAVAHSRAKALADELALAGPDARGNATADPDADGRADWRDRADAHYAAARECVRTCWSAWVRAWAFVLTVAWALDPRTRFPAPPDADPPDWAFALAPHVGGFASWVRAELRPEPLFARWLSWVEDRQNRLLAASGFVGTVVSLLLAAAGQWPIDGLLGALVLWVLSVLYVPVGVTLALKQYRGEFDLPD